MLYSIHPLLALATLSLVNPDTDVPATEANDDLRDVIAAARDKLCDLVDRLSKRWRTMYLAYTPECGQKTMSSQLTRLLEEVLRRWGCTRQ